MRWIPVPLAVSLALAATAGLAADSPLRPEQMRGAMGLKLGVWKTKSRLVDLQVDSAPGGDQAGADRHVARFRALLGQDVLQNQCLQDRPDRLSLPGLHPPPGCDYSRLEARNGRFAVTSLCKDPGSEEAFEVALEGSYTPKRITVRSQASAPHPRGRMHLKIDIESRYSGSCDSPPEAETLPGEED